MPHILRPLRLLAVLALLLPLTAGHTAAQTDSRFFAETGHTVQGVFLRYWDAHGGLAEQGYPLTEERQEVSALDHKPYTVQYFERAVFERHPEYAGTVYEVLLAQLGTYEMQARYPGGAPPSTPSTINPRLFTQTGHTVGGTFRAYWESHGGLAQQGYPLTDEFQEVSALDGKMHTVQYFERAIFEQHPENAGTPYEVELAQLGKYQLDRQNGGNPTPAPGNPTPTTPPAPPPTAVPAPPTAVPSAGLDSCDGIPAAQNMELNPPSPCAAADTNLRYTFIGSGFQPHEDVGIYATGPDGAVYGDNRHGQAGGDGRANVTYDLGRDIPSGLYAFTIEGVTSHHKAIGYLKLTTPHQNVCANVPTGDNATAAPNCGPPGTVFFVNGYGFQPYEEVGVYVTFLDNGQVADLGIYHVYADASGRAEARVVAGNRLTRRAGTLEGLTSHHRAVAYYDVK